jgi:serine protease AprX
VQEALLKTLLVDGRAAWEGRVQNVWPLDAEAAFGALPTPLRLRADPRFSGRGITIALVDAAFHPHPDLVRPENRIRAWVDASSSVAQARWFGRDDVPTWPEPPGGNHAGQRHGLMTSATAAGNGWLSHGLYRGLAPESDLALVQVSERGTATSDSAIVRAVSWLGSHAAELKLRVVSLSVGGGEVAPDAANEIDEAVAALVAQGIVVVAAAGNGSVRRLAPPATSPHAITVGGLDDCNTIDPSRWQLWHSNFGSTDGSVPKPEVVAPSVWTVAPILPGTEVAIDAERLFAERARERSDDLERAIAERRLITPHYQHVEGTSFAAPIVAAIAACMCEANPRLSPQRVKELLMLSATRLPSAPDARQGAGVADAGLAVAAALADDSRALGRQLEMPLISDDRVDFVLRGQTARSVAVVGGWNNWRAPGVEARRTEEGVWRASIRRPSPGRYSYKYLIDSNSWMPDPANPVRLVDLDGNVNSVLEIT